MKKILKSIWAVVAGILVIVMLSVITDMVLEGVGVFPSPSEGLFVTWMLVLALLYRTVYAVIGGYVTAILAPQNSTRHVLGLNIIGIIMGILGIVAGWDLSAHWYPFSLVFASALAVWYGGKLRRDTSYER
jgi:hypothetical protein